MTRWLFHFMLKLSYSSERGAAAAYHGHQAVCARADHRDEVRQVREEELHHRRRLGEIMADHGVRANPLLEAWFWAFGNTVGLGCRVWPEWASAIGASWFEVNGVAEFQRLHALAERLGEAALAEEFAEMAQQEDDHRKLFRRMAGEAWRPQARLE